MIGVKGTKMVQSYQMARLHDLLQAHVGLNLLSNFHSSTNCSFELAGHVGHLLNFHHGCADIRPMNQPSGIICSHSTTLPTASPTFGYVLDLGRSRTEDTYKAAHAERDAARLCLDLRVGFHLPRQATGFDSAPNKVIPQQDLECVLRVSITIKLQPASVASLAKFRDGIRVPTRMAGML